MQFPPWITISLHPSPLMAAGCLYPCWLLADLKTLPLFQHYLQSIRIFAEDTFCTRTNLCFLIQNLKRKYSKKTHFVCFKISEKNGSMFDQKKKSLSILFLQDEKKGIVIFFAKFGMIKNLIKIISQLVVFVHFTLCSMVAW